MAETPPQTPSQAADGSPPAAVQLLTAIAEQLKDTGDEIRKKVIESRVILELDKRADALDKAIGARSAAAGDLKKVDKFDAIVYGADSKPTHEGYTKERLKEIENAKRKLGKIDKCIGAALNGEWGKLNEIK